MITKEVKDKDGRPYFFVAYTPDALATFERDHRQKAEAIGCLLREIPILGSAEPGPFHESFLVDRDERGVITKIARRA